MNLIPQAVAHAQQVDASTNGPFQRWLAAEIEREDWQFWATTEDAPIVMALPEKITRPMVYRFLP